MSTKSVTVRVERTTTWRLEPEAVANILRSHLGAAGDAEVEFDCDYLRGVTVRSTKIEQGDDSDGR